MPWQTRESSGMRTFLMQYKILLLAICLVLLGLHLASSALNKGENTGPAGRVIITVYTPIHKTISWPFRQVARFFQNYILLLDLRDENRALKKKNEALLLEWHRLREMESENLRFRRLLNFPAPLKVNPIFARVVAKTISNEFRTILVGTGRKSGVAKGMVAVTAAGLLGHVCEVTPNAAKILLITDASSVVDAVIQRTRASGIVRGRSRNTCSMEFLNRTDDVEVGDTVVSSGIGGVFPKGYLIGPVTKIDRESNDMFQDVEITPPVDYEGLEEIILLPGEKKTDLEADLSSPGGD